LLRVLQELQGQMNVGIIVNPALARLWGVGRPNSGAPADAAAPMEATAATGAGALNPVLPAAQPTLPGLPPVLPTTQPTTHLSAFEKPRGRAGGILAGQPNKVPRKVLPPYLVAKPVALPMAPPMAPPRAPSLVPPPSQQMAVAPLLGAPLMAPPMLPRMAPPLAPPSPQPMAPLSSQPMAVAPLMGAPLMAPPMLPRLAPPSPQPMAPLSSQPMAVASPPMALLAQSLFSAAPPHSVFQGGGYTPPWGEYTPPHGSEIPERKGKRERTQTSVESSRPFAGLPPWPPRPQRNWGNTEEDE
jgi:hypothetical protein